MTRALAERVNEAFEPRVFVNHYGSTEIYTFSIHRDQAAKPGCAGRAALNARLRLVRPDPDAGPDDLVGPGDEGQIICHLSLGRGVRRATGSGPTPTRRRSRTAGTSPATSAASTRTATSGSSAGWTT